MTPGDTVTWQGLTCTIVMVCHAEPAFVVLRLPSGHTARVAPGEVER